LAFDIICSSTEHFQEFHIFKFKVPFSMLLLVEYCHLAIRKVHVNSFLPVHWFLESLFVFTVFEAADSTANWRCYFTTFLFRFCSLYMLHLPKPVLVIVFDPLIEWVQKRFKHLFCTFTGEPLSLFLFVVLKQRGQELLVVNQELVQGWALSQELTNREDLRFLEL
jgi:hypothetical protein